MTSTDAIGVLPWQSIWSADNPVEGLNAQLSLLVECFVLTKVIRVRNKDEPWFNDDCRLAFDIKQGAHLRWTCDCSRVYWDELSITRGGPRLYMPRLCVSLVSEARMFWWTPSVPISGGRPWSLLYSAQVRIHLFLLLLGQVVVWSVSWSGRQICCRLILMETSRSAIHLPSVSQSHYLCLQVTGGEAAPAGSRFLWWHWPIGNV